MRKLSAGCTKVNVSIPPKTSYLGGGLWSRTPNLDPGQKKKCLKQVRGCVVQWQNAVLIRQRSQVRSLAHPKLVNNSRLFIRKLC